MKNMMGFNVRFLSGVALLALLLSALCYSPRRLAAASNTWANVAVASDGHAPSPPAVQKPGSDQRFVQVRLQFIRVSTGDLAEKLTVYSTQSNLEDARPLASGSEATALFDALKPGPPEAGASCSVVTQDAHSVSASLHSSSHSLRVMAGKEKKPGSEDVTVTVTPRINGDGSITLLLGWSNAAAMPSREHSKEVIGTVQNGEMIMLRAFPIDARTEMLLLATPTILGLPPEAIKIDGGDGLTKLRALSSEKIRRLFNKDLGGGLLPIGTTAPDFTLPTPQGKEVSFDTVLQGNKALILSFWFIGCPPCREELPHLQDLYNQFHSRGLGILAINNRGDAPDSVAAFMQKNKLILPVALDPNQVPDIYQDWKTWKSTISGKYQAGGAPIIYIIGPSGKVVWREIGYDAETDKSIRRVLATLGLN